MLAHRLGDGRWQLCLLGSLGLQVTGKPTQSGSNNKNLYYFIKKKKNRARTDSHSSSAMLSRTQFFPSLFSSTLCRSVLP